MLLLASNMKKNELITQDKKILDGKPIIAGTRMSVEVILEFLAGGMEIKEMLKEYPFLSRNQIKAAIEYAAERVGREKGRPGAESSSAVAAHEIHR